MLEIETLWGLFLWDRAQPDWAYEFPDRTRLDTRICWTGNARPDWIQTYIFKHFIYHVWVINFHNIRSLDINLGPNLVSKVDKKKSWKNHYSTTRVHFEVLPSPILTVQALGAVTTIISKDIHKYLHIWPPLVAIFLALWVWEDLELVSICNSLNNSEGMTIFGRNDTNTEGMTIIRKEWQ